MRMRKIVAKFLSLLAWMVISCVVVTNSLAESICVMQVFASGGLRVRTEPSLDGTVVYLLENRETVVVFESRDGWYRVGKNLPPHVELGWVCGDYIK